MALLHRVGTLEIADDPRFTQRSWSWERAGWGLLVVVVAGALAGLLGPGPLSNAKAAGPDGALRIEYERFVRLETASRLRLLARAGEAVWLDRAYAERVKIERVRPEPLLVAVEADRVTYRFPPAPAGSTGEIEFEVRFRRPGRLRARAGVAGGEAAEFVQVVYP